MVLFKHNVKNITGAAYKNGNVDGMCERLFTWCDCDCDLSQLMGCLGFIVTVTIAPREHLHCHPTEVICCDLKLAAAV